MSGRVEKTQVQTVTKNGEITINLVLTIKLENGNISVSTTNSNFDMNKMTKRKSDIDEDVDLIVPEIAIEPPIKFGEIVES